MASSGGERFQRATKKKVPLSLKEIIAEFNPHRGYTDSIRVVVPAARRVTGMIKGFVKKLSPTERKGRDRR